MIYTQPKDKSQAKRLVSTPASRNELGVTRTKAKVEEIHYSHTERQQFFFTARTLDELMKIQAEPPALGFVQFRMGIENVVTVDPETGDPLELIEETVYVPWAAYFVRTYPPKPIINYLTMPVADGGVQVWSTKIYQPSAGISGALVYFDKDIPMLENTIGVGVELGYPSGNSNYGKRQGLYKITHVNTKLNSQNKEVIESVVIDYANGLKTNELTWLRCDLIPPWGPNPSAIPLDSALETNWQLPTYIPPDLRVD